MTFAAEKRFVVTITKTSGAHVEFSRYVELNEAELAAHALRKYGIDATAAGPIVVGTEQREVGRPS